MKRKKVIGQFSEDSIKQYLDDKVYEKQGLTRNEYIDRCKVAWRKVRYDPNFERKVVIDFSEPVTVQSLFGITPADFDFLDSAVVHQAVNGFENRTGIECIKWFMSPDMPGHGRPTPIPIAQAFGCEQPSDRSDILEQQIYLIALFDVLGFSNMVQARGIDAILESYKSLIDIVILKRMFSTFGRVATDGRNRYMPGSILRNIGYTYFSDTIMLWDTATPDSASAFLARCADLICEALKIGMPLRGGICLGKAVMNKAEQNYIGPAIVEASNIEKNQRWIGATLGYGFAIAPLRENLSEALVVPCFCEHFKPGFFEGLDPEMDGAAFSYLTLDWIGRWKEREATSPNKVLEELKQLAPEKNKVYYDNTINYVEFAENSSHQSRATFLRAEKYHVRDLRKVNLDALLNQPVILKVRGEVPLLGYILTLPDYVLNSNRKLRRLFDKKILFVNHRDYGCFCESLPEEAGVAFNLAESGVVIGVNKSDVEYIDAFNYDPNNYDPEQILRLTVID